MQASADSPAAEAARVGGGVLQRFPVVLYFLMAYGFTWSAVSPMVLARAGVIQADFPVELIRIVGALARPALAGVIVSAGVGGRVLPTQMSPGIGSLVQSGWIPAITFAVWALILVVVTHGRLGYAGDHA